METLIKGLTPFNSVFILFLNVQYSKVEFWTFNFAAEMAQLVKRQVLLSKLICKTCCLYAFSHSCCETAEISLFAN